jgi:hypothetical protein
LKTVKKNIHRGKILQAAVEDKGINIDVLTKKAGYSRGAYYNHIKKADLPDKILEKYARVIQYDFSEDIPDFKASVTAEPEMPYLTKPHSLEEAIEQRDYYITKYIELLEEYRKMLTEKK